MTLSNEEFSHQVLDLIGAIPPFKPYVINNSDGDCVEFFVSDEEYYAERIDRFVTVYRGMGTNDIIGSLIKDISVLKQKFLNEYPGFCIIIQGGKIRLHHLFLAKILNENPEEAKIPCRIYQEILQIIEENDIAKTELELSPC